MQSHPRVPPTIITAPLTNTPSHAEAVQFLLPPSRPVPMQMAADKQILQEQKFSLPETSVFPLPTKQSTQISPIVSQLTPVVNVSTQAAPLKLSALSANTLDVQNTMTPTKEEKTPEYHMKEPSPIVANQAPTLSSAPSPAIASTDKSVIKEATKPSENVDEASMEDLELVDAPPDSSDEDVDEHM